MSTTQGPLGVRYFDKYSLGFGIEDRDLKLCLDVLLTGERERHQGCFRYSGAVRVKSFGAYKRDASKGYTTQQANLQAHHGMAC